MIKIEYINLLISKINKNLITRVGYVCDKIIFDANKCALTIGYAPKIDEDGCISGISGYTINNIDDIIKELEKIVLEQKTLIYK